MADSLEKISQSVRETNLNLQQLQSTITSLQNELMSQKSRNLKEEELSRMKISDLNDKMNELDRWSNVIKDLDDIPGVRTPRWYEVDINFPDGNETDTTFNSVEISPDGPFIITQMQPYFQVTDTQAAAGLVGGGQITGRILPCSSYPILMNTLGSAFDSATNTLPLAGDLFNTANQNVLQVIPEFSFQIEIAGSGRFWTNRAIPAAAFYGQYNPLYTGIAGWVERTDRIVVHVTPNVAVPLKGTVKVVFHGYQILGHVNVGQALGY